MSRAHSLVLPTIIALSALAHAGAFLAVRGEPRAPAAPPSLVEIAIAPPPPAPASPPPAPEPTPPKAAPRPSRAAASPRAIARPASPSQPPVQAAPSPADFTGTTLTNETGTGWAAAAGNGEPMTGPIGAPAPTRVEPARPRATGANERPVVALADLSQPPRAPDLNEALVQNYPVAARERGVAGKAIVRARIGADGKAHVLDIVSESLGGFGVACRRTLDGSRWKPPLDRAGQAVDTVLTYTCRFEVGT